MILLSILVFIIILGLLVFVHELGHFLMARRAGMTVEEFGFGFPPRIFGIKRGKTLYSINWIPLGGFVKILGENGESDEPGAFSSKPAFSRFLVLVAGVSMNVILAWVLLSAAMGLGIPTILDQGEALPASARTSEAHIAIVYVEPDTPAAAAGLKVGDVITAVDGHEFTTIQEVQDFTSANAGQKLDYTITRGSEQRHVQIIPRPKPPTNEGPLGVALGMVATVSYPWYEAIGRGLVATGSLIVQIVASFLGLIASLFTSHSEAGSLTGPIGIAVLTRDATRLGFVYLLQFAAVLSVNLAIINILPFPALDGGRVFFLAVEALRRRRLNIKFEYYANTIGFLLLIALLIWVSGRDIVRFSGQFHSLWDKIRGAV